jgi:hypothetical protein
MWAGSSPALVLFLEMFIPNDPKNRGIVKTQFSKAIELDCSWWMAKTKGSRSSAKNWRLISPRTNSSFFPEGFHLDLIQADYLEGHLKSGWFV